MHVDNLLVLLARDALHAPEDGRGYAIIRGLQLHHNLSILDLRGRELPVRDSA